MAEPVATRPRFSIVSAAYNVEKYLGEFLDSLAGQDFSLDDVEIILVDDGSTDGTRNRLQQWSRRSDRVLVLHKENGGQSSARNLGLQHASGEWVTFPDPDDILQPDYLREVDEFIRARPDVQMVATNRVLFDDATGQRRSHPLSAHFTTRNRLRNLDAESGHFHGSAPAAFFRLDELRRQQLTFDDRIKPSFEDGEFCCRYLLGVDVPWVAYVQSAVYLYRKRSDRSSTLDNSWADPRKYADMVEHGFLGLLRDATEARGTVPGWLQSMILYEVSWYFKTENSIEWIATSARGDIAERFVGMLREIVRHLDPALIEAYPSNRLRAEFRDILLHGLSPEPWHASTVVVDRIDPRQQTMRLRYRFAHSLPAEAFLLDGAEVTPLASKIRSLVYFDHELLQERIVWLPLGTVEVALNGAQINVSTEEPPQYSPRLDSWTMRRQLDPSVQAHLAAQRPRLTLRDRLILRLADSKPVTRRFGRAWVLMDRVHNADDSAELLFRYLRRRRRKINAWFVIESGTPDHARLRRAGYRRLIPFGSLRWKLLMLNADRLISSHIDHQIVRPQEILRLRETNWQLVFLQHGVIKDDLSRWLNTKSIDLLVTSTPDEHRSIVGDHTPYTLTEREVKQTGLPRFDSVLAAGRRVRPAHRDLILLAPTWRSWLTGTATGVHRRNADRELTRNSDFVRNWWALLGSDKLRALAEANGASVALLLHPNLQSVSEHLATPPHVQMLAFEGQDVREMFARTKVFVTDYSSMAFNAAYIDRPLVYFQFDADRFFGGGHLGRRGYFDFERDGFGPVAYTADAAADEIGNALEHGSDPAPPYLDRIAAAFPLRDGKCTERTFFAIRDSTKRVRARSVHPEEVPVDATGTAPLGLEEVAADPDDLATQEAIGDVPDDVASAASAASAADAAVSDT